MYSAGILLYIVLNNEKHFLLGKDDKYNSWSDFGGKCDPSDNSDPLITASREFYEETSGIIMHKSQAYTMIKDNSELVVCSSYKKQKYFMYLLEHKCIDYKTFTTIFNDQNKYLCEMKHMCPKKFKEKKELGWFTVDDILRNAKSFRGVFFNSIQKHEVVIRSA